MLKFLSGFTNPAAPLRIAVRNVTVWVVVHSLTPDVAVFIVLDDQGQPTQRRIVMHPNNAVIVDD